MTCSNPKLTQISSNLWKNFKEADFTWLLKVGVQTITKKKWAWLRGGEKSFLGVKGQWPYISVKVYHIVSQMKGNLILNTGGDIYFFIWDFWKKFRVIEMYMGKATVLVLLQITYIPGQVTFIQLRQDRCQKFRHLIFLK